MEPAKTTKKAHQNDPKPPTKYQYNSMRPEKTFCLRCCVMLCDVIVLDTA